MSYRSELAIQAAAHADRTPPAPLAFFRARLTTRPDESAPQAVKAFLVATTPHGALSESRYTLREIADARIEALRLGAILTAEDIPAGDGIASLFIAADADGKPSLWRQRTIGAPEVVYRPPSHGSKGEALLWALIETHVPTVTD